MDIREVSDGDIWEVSNDEERIEVDIPQTNEPDREKEEVSV